MCACLGRAICSKFPRFYRPRRPLRRRSGLPGVDVVRSPTKIRRGTLKVRGGTLIVCGANPKVRRGTPFVRGGFSIGNGSPTLIRGGFSIENASRLKFPRPPMKVLRFPTKDRRGRSIGSASREENVTNDRAGVTSNDGLTDLTQP